MMKRTETSLAGIAALACAVAASPALAHPGHGAPGMGAGLVHPLTGVDHFVAMVAIGLLAAKQRTAPVWLLPFAFVAMMAIGMASGSLGSAFAGTELAVAACLILVGIALMNGRHLSLSAGACLAGVSGLAHGLAHAGDSAGLALPAQFNLGALGMTGALHLAGALSGRAILSLPANLQSRGWQCAGLTAAATGAFMFGA